MPVLTDDALIMCLDDLPSSSNSTEGKGEASATAAADAATALQPSGASSDLASKNATLEAQLEELTKQFANYRVAVEQTLDKRWLAEDDDSSSTSSAAGPSKKEEKDSSKYYWEGYAHHGEFEAPSNRAYLCKKLTSGAKCRNPRDDAKRYGANGCVP